MSAKSTARFGGFAAELAARRLIGGILELARFAQDYLLVAVSLVCCVAAPIQAAQARRLVEP